jgi:hypothetical protein
VIKRREAVLELTADGMSQRQVGEVLGVDESQIRRDIRAANAAPDAANSNGDNSPQVDAAANAASPSPPDPAVAEAARPTRPAERMRRHRARERDGQIVLRLTINEADIVHALIASEALAPGDADDRRQVECAVERLLTDWAAAWRERV